MKIRNDFVSNSSSSSFIIADSWFFYFFNITKKDICDAIMDLYGKSLFVSMKLKHIQSVRDDWEKARAESKPGDFEYDYAKERLDDLKSKGYNLWQVVDLSKPKEKEACYAEWDSHFADWDAPNAERAGVYDSVMRAFADAGMYEVEYAMHTDSDEIPTFYNRKTKKDEPIPDYILKTVRFLREKLEIKTMKEVLHDENTRFMIHFDDNELWNLDGMSSEDKCWKTDNYTTLRFYEVLINYFITKGKVDLANKDFLEYWKVPDDHWWKTDARHKDKTYFLEDQNKASIEEIIETFHEQSIGHEG